MITAGNDSSNAGNDNNMSTANSNTRVNSTNNNLCDYFSFNMCLVLNYTNNQLIYYYISDTISAAEQPQFQQLMKQHKIFLDLLNWDSASNKNNDLRENSKDS